MKTPQKQNEPMTWPTLSSAAGALEVSGDVLSRAKRAGCPAFGAGGRVHGKRLLQWLLSRPESKGAPALSLEQAKARLAQTRASVLERKAQVEIGEVVPLKFAVGAFDDAHWGLIAAANHLPEEFSVYRQGTSVRDEEELKRCLENLRGVFRRAVQSAREVFIAAMRAGPDGEGGNALDEAHKAIETVTQQYLETGKEFLQKDPVLFGQYFARIKAISKAGIESTEAPPATGPTPAPRPTGKGKPARRA